MLGGNAILRARVTEAFIEGLAFPLHGREVGVFGERTPRAFQLGNVPLDLVDAPVLLQAA